MDENNNGFNTTDTNNLNDAPQFDYSQPNYGQPGNPPQPDYSQPSYSQQNYGQPGNPPQFDYSQQGYGQPNNTAQSDYNQVYNQPNYNPQYNSYPNYSGGYQTEKKSDTKSILSLVFGIVGIIVCNCGGIGGVGFGIAGVIMAIMSKGDNDGQMNGMAVAGMIISILSFIIGLAMLIFMVYIMVNGGSVLT